MVTPCKSILIVEDDELIRETLKQSLELEGYSVSSASNGQEGLELLRTMPSPCLILLDLMMPIMDGREFLAIQEKEVALAPIPVVVVSAFPGRAAEIKNHEFIRKPVDLDLLLSFVKRYCQ